MLILAIAGYRRRYGFALTLFRLQCSSSTNPRPSSAGFFEVRKLAAWRNHGHYLSTFSRIQMLPESSVMGSAMRAPLTDISEDWLAGVAIRAGFSNRVT